MPDEWLTALGPAQSLTTDRIFLSLAVSFVLGSLLGLVYRQTHHGFSYTRAFVQTLVLSGLVAALMIIAIGNNLARGLGILGALAIIRFRTPIRDPRDIIFLFASLAVGISCGVELYNVAIAGTVAFAAAAFYLHWAPFTSRREFEGLLRFVLPVHSPSLEAIQTLLPDFTASAELVTLREALQGNAMEYAYQIKLLDPACRTELMAALEGLPGVSEISLHMQRASVEI